MAYQENNQTILTGIPVAPANFFNVSRQKGIYIVGSNSFTARNLQVAPYFRRKVGGATEDFILGIISVLLIAVFAEIVQTVLMRSRNRRISGIGLHTAYLIDEFSHFRNVWAHITGNKLSDSGGIYTQVFRRRTALLSLLVMLIAVALFAADVVAVYLTQPQLFSSSATQYNLRGVQPVGTYRWQAEHIRRLSFVRPCVSPFIRFAEQKRNFQINTCITYENHRALDGPNELSDMISVGSWYHKGGSDHNVTFGEGWWSVKVRTEIFLDTRARAVKRILYNTSDDQQVMTKYLHDVFMYGAMEWACSRKYSRAGCSQLVSELENGTSVPTEKEIFLWNVQGKSVLYNSTGLVTTYAIRINEPFTAVRESLRSLVASSAIQEVSATGWYEDGLNAKQDVGLAGLVAEEGRTAGVPMLSLVLLVFGVLLIGLRSICEPVSLAAVAFHEIGNGAKAGVESGLYEVDDKFDEDWEVGASAEGRSDCSTSYDWKSGLQEWSVGESMQDERGDRNQYTLQNWNKDTKSPKIGALTAHETEGDSASMRYREIESRETTTRSGTRENDNGWGERDDSDSASSKRKPIPLRMSAGIWERRGALVPIAGSSTTRNGSEQENMESCEMEYENEEYNI